MSNHVIPTSLIQHKVTINLTSIFICLAFHLAYFIIYIVLKLWVFTFLVALTLF